VHPRQIHLGVLPISVSRLVLPGSVDPAILRSVATVRHHAAPRLTRGGPADARGVIPHTRSCGRVDICLLETSCRELRNLLAGRPRSAGPAREQHCAPGFLELPDTFAEASVRLVNVEAFPSSKLRFLCPDLVAHGLPPGGTPNPPVSSFCSDLCIIHGG
jgi:hypothetical protein